MIQENDKYGVKQAGSLVSLFYFGWKPMVLACKNQAWQIIVGIRVYYNGKDVK
ncbi:hypothetical protein MLOOGBEN_26200 [Bacillus sp. EB106-08-02-XG196]|uniref:hypothetical protein n=1 Tax=Bacillus sp. EB106-08-02-XG196 TaxID=2737049 RepID=UPI0015C433CD|nr:hypothetical protein [Bacillus sp. EB106-08-02-XG196]NWQ44182.1 hypothetical protein [Bacillus sp. EB106-08-02-XG196]